MPATTTTTPLHHHDPVSTALTLNNMAVDLLKKEEYGSALRALRASLSLMQLSAGGSSSAARTSALDDHDICMTAEIDAVDDHDMASLRAAVMFGPSASVMFPIVISSETSTTHDDDNWLQACKNYGIILYNHGLASFLLSCQQLQPENDFTQESYLSFQQAEDVFASLAEVQEQMVCKGTAASSTVPLLRMLVLSFLGLLYHSQELHQQADEAIRMGSQLLLQHDAQR